MTNFTDQLHEDLFDDVHLKLLSKVIIDESTGDCWNWNSVNLESYGQIYINGRANGVHRLSWELFNGPLKEGLVIDHKCRNRRCINPDHLRLVTQGINATENNNSAAALNKAKTHCHRGHEFNSANTYSYVNHSGTLARMCKECGIINQRKRRGNKERIFKNKHKILITVEQE